MKKRFMLPIAAVALFGLMASFATSAQAVPAQTMLCSGCHVLNTSIAVSPTLLTNNGTTASYDITVSSAFGMQGWAVFDGFTKVAGSSGATGTVVLPTGKTYTVIGAGGTFVGDGTGTHDYNSTTISPAKPPAPVLRTVKIKIAKTKLSPKALTALLTSKANGKKFKASMSKTKGWVWATFKRVPVGTYKLTVTGKKFKFKARTVVVK